MTPTAIAHYRVLSSLGAGGMGEVYLAEDARLGRLVAIKLLPAELTRDAARLRRFELEARAVSALNHPNIVTIYEIGEADVGRFIVLEYVKGQTLRSLIGGRRNAQAIAPIGRQIATALSVAHAAGMIHRDIKPENVMVRDDGYVKVLDFGLARLTSSDDSSESTADTAIHTKPGVLVGTVAYMSPEQVRAESVASPSDIFSLGVILYEMATGRKPFRAGPEMSVMYQIVHDQPPPPSALNTDLPVPLDALIVRMLRKQPADRPSAVEVAAALGGSHEASSSVAGAQSSAQPGAARRTVGRASERGRLRAAYDAARSGRGAMLCVTGEAGIGKTTLVEDTLADLQLAHPECLIARGRSSERLAGAEAYLPVLEALDSLVRSTPAVARVMKTRAPSWYVQLATSLDASVERMINESQTVSQERMKRELGTFLQDASIEHPLVLFFDDLHWADTSTVDILAYVATKLSAMHLLIVATYRPTEMLLQKHPFLRVVLDMRSRGVCQELPLAFLSRDDVDRYLALEFPDHRFPPQFAPLIYAKTEGNPLLMADVVRYLRTRKVIGQADGRWALVQTMPEIEHDLPETIRSMIQRKIDQLDEGDRALLRAASVQGYTFDSAVVARVLGLDAGDVEERLQTLEHTHGFVASREEDEFPDHTLTLRYRFVHVLYQNAIYATLTPSRRAALSAAAADALLAFHGDAAPSIASELAFLFQTARDWARASEYFLKAARNAARIFANQEAIALCRRGLEMTSRLPDTADRARQELRLQMTLGPSLMTVKGFAASESLQTHLRARDLSEQLGDETQLFRVQFGLAIVSVVRAEYEKAAAFADRCLVQAEGANDAALLVQAHWVSGLAVHFMRQFGDSCRHFERSIALYDAKAHAAHIFLYGAILNRMHLARALLYLGETDRSTALAADGMRAAEKAGHPLGLANVLSIAVTLEAFHRRAGTILDMTRQLLFYADEHGLPHYRGIGTIMRGWARALQGEVDDGCREMRTGLDDMRQLEAEQQRAYYLILMAEALLEGDRVGEGLEAIAEAIDFVNRTGERFYEAELYRIQGDLLVRSGRLADGEASIRTALEIARSQGAKAFEARADASLASLRGEYGRR